MPSTPMLFCYGSTFHSVKETNFCLNPLFCERNIPVFLIWISKEYWLLMSLKRGVQRNGCLILSTISTDSNRNPPYSFFPTEALYLSRLTQKENTRFFTPHSPMKKISKKMNYWNGIRIKIRLETFQLLTKKWPLSEHSLHPLLLKRGPHLSPKQSLLQPRAAGLDLVAQIIFGISNRLISMKTQQTRCRPSFPTTR